MPRFFVKQDQICDEMIDIIGEDARHIARALRMAVGETVTVCDMRGNEYSCSIVAFDDDKKVSIKINETRPSENEPPSTQKPTRSIPLSFLKKSRNSSFSDIVIFFF